MRRLLDRIKRRFAEIRLAIEYVVFLVLMAFTFAWWSVSPPPAIVAIRKEEAEKVE